jgi:hypothetical protein
MTWPMNMSHGKLFGAKWNADALTYVYTETDALLKTGKEYSSDELNEFMKLGGKAYLDRSDRGKDIGTMTHKAVEVFLTHERSDGSNERADALKAGAAEGGGELSKEDSEALKKAFTAFADWWDGLADKEVISTERPLYSRQLNYAGTTDIIARINGKVYMLDLKTTNSSKKAPLGIYAEYFMQLGAYSHAYKEETGQEFDDCGIIRTSKDGKLTNANAVDMGITDEECERAFAFAIRVHDWLERTTPFLADAHFTSHLSELAQGRTSDVA